jgi:hypothetical protein
MLSLLMDIASGTVADPDLAQLVLVRPHCVEAIATQALYVALLVNRLKAACLSHLPTQSSTPRALQPVNDLAPVATPLQIRVTVVGLGGVGTRIVETFLASQRIHPTAIAIVTRQSKFKASFADAGVRCFNSFEESLHAPDLLVVACQPGHFTAAAKMITSSGKLAPSTVVFAVCCGISADKVAAELEHPLCLASSVDTDRITRTTEGWEKEDAVVAQHRRAAFTASKTMLEVQAVQLSPEEAAIAATSDGERRRQRRLRLLDLSFPSASIEFSNRIIHVLTASAMQRGLTTQGSLQLALHLTLARDAIAPTKLPTTKGLSPDALQAMLPELCGMVSLSSVTGVHQRELATLFKARFDALVSECTT